MKYDGKRSKLHHVEEAPPEPRLDPALCELWDKLQRAAPAGGSMPIALAACLVPSPGAQNTAPCACRYGTALSSGVFPSSGAFLSSENGGSGSGGFGYGLGLIDPDPGSAERIRMIMRLLCERDEKRKR